MRGSAYGVYLVGEPIDVGASISAFPAVSLPLASKDMRENLDVRITSERGRLIAPNRPVPSMPSNNSWEREYGGVRLSDWGYNLGLGSYRITYALKPYLSDWAATRGYEIIVKPAELRIVRQYSDVDPHFFPAPSGWTSGGCEPWYVDGRPTFEVLHRSKDVTSGEECFQVYLFSRASGDGLARERFRANSSATVPLSETTVACGSVRATVFTYRLEPQSARRTESVVMPTRDGYIVARYTRPDTAPDDPAALDALKAPCLLL